MLLYVALPLRATYHSTGIPTLKIYPVAAHAIHPYYGVWVCAQSTVRLRHVTDTERFVIFRRTPQ